MRAKDSQIPLLPKLARLGDITKEEVELDEHRTEGKSKQELLESKLDQRT